MYRLSKAFAFLALLPVLSFCQISKYGTGNPPEFSFTLQSTLTINHNLNTERVIVSCYHTPVRTEFVKGTDYNVTVMNTNTVTVAFTTPPQSGVCVVNAGIGIGIQGIPGAQGARGLQGVGIASSAIDSSGNLILTLTDGSTKNAGMVKGTPGANGQNGIGITNTVVSNGHLMITKSDSSVTDAGSVVGPAGATGAQGPPGPAGAAPTWRGAWSADIPYSANETVFYQGTSYIAIGSSLNKAPDTNTSLWSQLAQKGDPGPTGPAGATGATLTTLGFSFSSQSDVSINHNYGTKNIVWACYTPDAIAIEGGRYENTDEDNSVVHFLGNQTGYCVPNGGIGPKGDVGPQGTPGTGAGITQLTGDVLTNPNSSGSTPATLKVVNSNVGAFGDATHSARITLDANGRVTAASSVSITGTGGGISSITLSGDATSSASTTGSVSVVFPTVNSSPGTYGDSTHCITGLVVNAKGLVTGASQSTTCPGSGGGGGSGLPDGSGVGLTASMSGSPADGAMWIATDQPKGQQFFTAYSGSWTQMVQVDSSGTLQFTDGALGATSIVARTTGATLTGNYNFQQGLSLNTSNTRPSCDTDRRGWFWYKNNGSSKDDVTVCVWTGSAFSWNALY